MKLQNLSLENREKLNISGVEQVESFNESQIVIYTVRGSLTIKGESLNISKLNLEDGNVKIEGTIESLAYSNKINTGSKEGSFFKKMFK
ncbi:sporulation protein YabP [Senegalia massiliensis]|uniref:Sporulation protein YabP n=2 Tax=Senegalia massiliensis TaxID=1720316 RepID=A0A845QZW3_9CLOT|nr:sporulation protein YabP [Senegalia massiliensis]NBI07494.1 sporulation protein YabP [Senegalia massiliensis]